MCFEKDAGKANDENPLGNSSSAFPGARYRAAVSRAAEQMERDVISSAFLNADTTFSKWHLMVVLRKGANKDAQPPAGVMRKEKPAKVMPLQR